MTEAAKPEAGSFRDPDATVFRVGDRVLRVLRGDAARDWEKVRRAPFLHQAVDAGQVVPTRTLTRDAWPAEITELLGAADTDNVTVLEHDRIPVISYPYEWTFAMLRDAALLHLDLVRAALDDGITTTDGTAYNVQFVGAKPQFIDVGSFVPYEGGAWNGYRQFCETFLNPLLIQAHTGVALQPLLRGRLEGVRPADARRILGFARVPRKGVFKNVLVHEYLERNVKSGSQAVGKQLSGSGFGSDLAKSTLDALRKLVRSLKIKDTKTAWTDYRTTCSYTSGEAAEKEAFVARVTGDRPDDLVLDLGCNDARFAQVVAKSVGTVVAVDFDPEVIDAAYRRLRDTNVPNVLALVVDLADPSPALGWANAERPAFTDRVRPDLVFALALVHHLVITANVPLARVLDWLLAFGADLVVEFPHPNDPMVVRLLEQKPAGQHDDFTLDVFLALLAERAEILEQQTLTEGTRTLVLCRPR